MTSFFKGEEYMQQQKSFKENDTGKLYLVPTPIGNLEDMTFRSIKTLQEVDVIASEDTRNTQKLLNHFDIKTKQMSFHEHNYKERIPELIEMISSGMSIAQVSDAGMPSISDPGHELVVSMREAGLPVVSLPGATAGVTALIASGLQPQPFYFYGFLGRKKSEQVKELEQMKHLSSTLIFYESPYRIGKTLKVMEEVLGSEREVVVCRELTKIHEEYTKGTITEMIAFYDDATVKGECCLLVSGFTGEVPVEGEVEWAHLSILEHVTYEMTEMGLNKKDAIKKVAKVRDLKKQDVYKVVHTDA